MFLDTFFEEARERLRRDGALSHLQLDRPKFGAELEPAWESATAHADWFEFEKLEHDPHDSVERWVVGSFFWALLDRARDAAPDGGATENTVRTRSILRSNLELLSPTSIATAWQARWELAAAFAAQAWTRIEPVTARWGEIAPHQRARALFDAGRALFLSAHFNGYARQLDPDLWISLEVGDPRFDLLDHDILDYILYRMGLQLVQPSNAREWTDVSKLPPDAVDRVISASAFLERSLAGSSLPVAPTTQAIQAWCDYVRAAIRQDVAALDQAGKRFLTVERHPQHKDGDTRLQLKAADICFKAAGHQQHAEQVARVWTEQFPDDAAGWQRLAEVLTRSGAYEDAVTAYEQFVRLSPATDDDWQATLLLKLGLDAKMSRTLDASLRDLTATHPVRPIGEALLQWSWPPFASMSPLAQARWWGGLIQLSDRSISERIGPAHRGFAGAAFAEALAIELRARIFDQVADDLASEATWRRVVREASRDEIRILERLRSKELTLAELLALVRRTIRTGDALAPLISRRLMPYRRLLDFVHSAANRDRLEALVQDRNDSAHADVSDAAVAGIYGTAKTLIELLCVTGKSGPSSPAGEERSVSG